MVLVSNEWQNKCEDVPKTTANTTTTAGPNPTTAAAASTSSSSSATAASNIAENTTGSDVNVKNTKQIETVAGDSLNSTNADASATENVNVTDSSTAASTRTITKSLENDNANNEQLNKIEIVFNKNILNDADNNINERKFDEIKKNILKETDNLDESVLNYTNSEKIMAENTKESPLKEEKEEFDETQQTLNNNHDHLGNNNKDLEEVVNSFSNSNTNTLTTNATNIKTQQQQNILIQQQQAGFEQALSSAIQRALNAGIDANTTVAAAGLQPNFLSQLALTANVAGLQKSSTNINTPSNITAKQGNQSFNMLEGNSQNKNADSNLLEGSPNLSTTASTTSVPAANFDNNGQAKIVLFCEGNSHPFQTRTISLTPNVECMVGRLIAKSKASENNAIFDCKVLSRKHAVIWYSPDGKFWVKDTKSSNGTFINDNKLGDEEAELHFGDIVKFGVDVLENSRKEVHGCIIACVKLYLPDGREAISIDSSAHRSQFSGEGRISYDELHRLNLYIQETSQREKVLTSKLCNIQNVLDATRKNSALCWQSMITEDQLLHRIHSLEKKLQFMEKNVPENLLRNEVIKLLDDKSSYQHTAKEALRKVYQERCDAMQMLAKMETAYTQSDSECSLLRDQIMNSKQTLQEVNSRLLRLETEYNEFKDEVARQQQEAKEQEEQRIAELTEKLREHEKERDDLKKKISELLLKRADLLEDELEKQAIEKLDAAIADMDLGDDEDSSDEDDEDINDEEVVEKKKNKHNGEQVEAKEDKENDDDVDDDDANLKFVVSKKKSKVRPHLTSIFGDKLNGVDDEQEENSKLKKAKALEDSIDKSPPKRVKETTIMKWLQNSDLNKNDGSFDIFKAICNENEDESEDVEAEANILTEQELKSVKPAAHLNDFTKKLKNVQKNLQQLEAEIEKETDNENSANDDSDKVKIKQEKVEEEDEDDSSDDEDIEEGACAKQEFIMNSNGKTVTSNAAKPVLSKENKQYILLKSSVTMLREAYNEIWNSVREQPLDNIKEKSPPPNITVKTQFQTYATTTSPTKAKTKNYDRKTLIPSSASASDICESDSEVESITLSPVASSHSNVTVLNVNKESPNADNLLTEKLQEYQQQVGKLSEKLQQTEMEAQHTLEIMQVECDDVKLKMENLNRVIESLKSEKKALEQVISENKTNTNEMSQKTAEDSKTSQEIDIHLEKESELEEDDVMKAINVTTLEREEELITYKERLDEQQKENIELRNEIASLKLKANTKTTKDILLKQYLPCSFVILAIIIYFITTYY